ncbi:MAG: hypothetical protein QXL35_06660, partial [Candidatus Bathyarchaeia archaeon]
LYRPVAKSETRIAIRIVRHPIRSGGLNRRGCWSKVDRTCRDYICPVCGKVIPKGTEASELVIESLSAPLDEDQGRRGREGKIRLDHRKVYHRDCAITEDLSSKRCRWSKDLWIQRGVTEVVYHIGGREEVRIPLLSGEGAGSEAWERAAAKYRKIRSLESKGFGLRSEKGRAAE